MKNKYHPDNIVNRKCHRIMRALRDDPMSQTAVRLATGIDGYSVMACLSELVSHGYVTRDTTNYTFKRTS